MQIQHMPNQIVSDHVSIGGKSQVQRLNMDQDLMMGENLATRSNHTEE